ncbi:MAG: hypothetical protein LAQ30_30115 [Acidobacteriia bacterium]|nr:hypothetical protein [Terriglobia bacterium]
MKKLMTLMLGLSLLGGTVALFSQETPKAEKTQKAKKTKAPKKAKKTEEKK